MADKLRGGTTIGGFLAWHFGNMGSGSGLDADLLDGFDSTYFSPASHTHDTNTISNLDASDITTGTIDDARLPITITSDITGNAATATKLVASKSIALNSGVTGSALFDGSSNISITATVNHLNAVDDRDVKPNTTGIDAGIKAIKPFFTSLEGMTGVAGTDYQDLLVLDTYSDASGGKINALTFDKSTPSTIRHWQANQGDTTWGVPEVLAYQSWVSTNYEPVFAKNTGFNLNLGTTTGTVAAGDDSRIINGQTAFGWGDHSTQGYLTSYVNTTYNLQSNFNATNGNAQLQLNGSDLSSDIITVSGAGGTTVTTDATGNFIVTSSTIAALADLTDVNAAITPTDGQVLTYDFANSRWDAADPTGAGIPTLPSTIYNTETLTIPTDRQAVVSNLTIEAGGELIIDGEIGVIGGGSLSKAVMVTDSIETDTTSKTIATDNLLQLSGGNIQNIDGTTVGLALKGDYIGDIDTLTGLDAVGIYGVITGFTTCTSGLPYQPDGTQAIGNGTMEITYQANSDITIQTVKNSNGASFVFQRMKVGVAAWQAWSYYGSISGSNGNGYYIKHANGVIEQWGLKTQTSVPLTTAQGTLYRNASTAMSVSYPIAFVDTNYSVTFSLNTFLSMVSLNPYSKTTAGTNIIATSSISQTVNVPFEWKAIGRWRA